jgi:hypothetical protein
VNNLPASKNLLVVLSAFVALALVGCANVSVSRTETAYAPREANCAVSWEQGTFERLASQYEWVGEVTLHNETGLSLSDDKRETVEAQACQLGGDTLLRDTSGSAKVAGYSNQKFGVLRRRAPGDTGSSVSPGFDDAAGTPSNADFAKAQGTTRGKNARLR